MKHSFFDGTKWITVHPNGADSKGSPVLIDNETGVVKGGMGGKFNGEKITEVRKDFTGPKTPKSLSKGEKTLKKAKDKIDLSIPDRIPADKILQNRDRSTKGSLMQMMAISKKPDYGRMSPTRDFSSGAPVVAYGTVDDKYLGRKSYAVLPDGTRLPVQYAVVEANEVLTSHNIHGHTNAEYNSSDPRKIRAIAGNGRITGVAEAYRNGNANEYRKELMEDEVHGVDENVISSMKNPVLVRFMQAKDVTSDIGDKSNISTGLQMTAVERANNDANRIDFNKVQTYENGDYTLDSIKAFVGAMPMSEQGELIDSDGKPTRQALFRMQAAIFAKAYKNDNLTRLQTQALDPESKTIINGLEKASKSISELEGLPDGYDVRDIVAEAAEKAVKAKSRGDTLYDAAHQLSMTGGGFGSSDDDDYASAAILDMFAKNGRSSQKIAEKLTKMAETLKVEAGLGNSGLDMFEDKPSRNDLVRHALKDGFMKAKISDAKRSYWRRMGRRFFDAVFNDKKPPEGFFAGLRR